VDSPVDLSRDILARCRAFGFAAAGIAPIAPSRWAGELTAWLAAGRHGTMDYLARDIEMRLSPGGVLENAQAFIMVADLYSARGEARAPSDSSTESVHGRIARYAQGRNYHWVMKNRLHALSDAWRAEFPGAEFRTFVDTVPVLERELAELAGIGWQAKNTMLIHPRLGSYFFLGGVATTLRLEAPEGQGRVADHCGSCTRCIDACPTQAITPYSVDGSRCISYLTIERREAIAPEFFGAMGEWLYGCDVCQEVCPHNSGRGPEVDTGSAHPEYEPKNSSFDLLTVLGWDDAARRAAFRASPLKRANLEMMKRNALIVAGNVLGRGRGGGGGALLARIREVAVDEAESEMVRATARDVLSAL